MLHTTKYTMVLWSCPPQRADVVVPGVMRLLSAVSEKPLQWHFDNSPNRAVPSSQDQWQALVKESRDKDDNSLSLFFSSPEGLSIRLTSDYPVYVRGFDALAVGFDTGLFIGRGGLFSFERLIRLFKDSVRLFQPFWARLWDSDVALTDDYNTIRLSVDTSRIPATVQWFNYLSENMVKRLGGREKLLDAPAFRVEDWDNPPGILLVLQREPFDCDNPRHRERQQELLQYLELSRLHAQYPRDT